MPETKINLENGFNDSRIFIRRRVCIGALAVWIVCPECIEEGRDLAVPGQAAPGFVIRYVYADVSTPCTWN